MSNRWYVPANKEMLNRVKSVMKKYHKPLIDAGVNLDVVMAHSEFASDALKVRGNVAYGCIRVLSLLDRSKGQGDAEMLLNAPAIEKWTENQLCALIDHELTHLKLIRSKRTNAVERDDLDRPRLGLIGHDFEFGWFKDVAKRWKDDSVEVVQYKRIASDDAFKQLTLFGEDVEDDNDVAEAG